MLKEVQNLVVQSQASRCDPAWSPEHTAALVRTSLGLSAGLFDIEKLLASELRCNQRSSLIKPAARCCRYLLEIFPLLGVDISVYPASEKLGHEMASRPMQMFLLRRDIATFATLVMSALYDDEKERATLLRKQQTLSLDLAYTALGIWGQFRRLLKRYRISMDDVLDQIKGDPRAGSAESA